MCEGRGSVVMLVIAPPPHTNNKSLSRLDEMLLLKKDVLRVDDGLG